MRHHDDAVAKFVERAQANPAAVAVIVTGSVGRGTERADSDVDVYLIVSGSEWARAARTGRIAWVETDGIGYEGGYLDVKLATMTYLADAADRGDDPVRASIQGSRIAWTRDPAIHEVVGRIATRPAEQWAALERSFVAQAHLHGRYFLRHGEQYDDALLLHHAGVHLATASARAVLAHRRVFFAGPKSLSATLGSLPDLPAGLVAALTRVVERPSRESADDLLALLEVDLSTRLSPDEALPLFIVDNELAWRTRVAPPEYR